VANPLAAVANWLLSALFQPLSAYNVAQESMTILTRSSCALRLAGYLTVLIAAAVPRGGAPIAAAGGFQAPTDPLPSACNPFGALATPRDIDQSCGLQGDPASTPGQHAQNRVKNNLCAADTTAAEVTQLTFDRLQDHTEQDNVALGQS
jgi:hypothetical protein